MKLRSTRLLCLLALLSAFPLSRADELADMRQHLAMIDLLVKAGRREAAAAQMRALFPHGAPLGGQLAIQYYEIIGNTVEGRAEASAGLAHLVKADPDNVGYRLALAGQLARAKETRVSGMNMFAAMAGKPDIRQKVLSLWRQALLKIDDAADSIALYRDYLAFDPDNSAISDALATAERARTRNLPWQLRHMAAEQLAAGQTKEAFATLQRALSIDPKNAWVRFDLARMDEKSGDRKAGLALMAAGLAAYPGDSDMLYANALYASLLDDPKRTLELLDKIPSAQLSASMKRLAQEMSIEIKTRLAKAAQARKAPKLKAEVVRAQAPVPSAWSLRDRAKALLARGRTDAAAALLEKALQLDPKNPWVRFDLARITLKRGDRKGGLALMQSGLALAPDDPGIRYANALYVALLDEPNKSLQLLERIPPAQRTPAMNKLFGEMTVQVEIRLARAAFAAGKPAAQRSAMAAAEAAADGNLELVELVADAWVDLKNPGRAVALLRPLAKGPAALMDYAELLNRVRQDEELGEVLTRLAAANLSVKQQDERWHLRFALAHRRAAAFLAAGNRAAAQAEMAKLLAATDPHDLEKRLAIADWYLDTNGIVDARAIVEPTRAQAPYDPRILVREGRIAKAEGDYAAALKYFRQAGARDEIAALERHRAKAYLETGENTLGKRDGSPGISNMNEADNSIVMHFPTGYSGGQVFAQLDWVSLDAGTLSLAGTGAYALNQYGKLASKTFGQSYTTQQQTLAAVLAPPSPASTLHGAALGVGYQRDGMRVDLGTTPRGFPISYLVGGVKWSHYTETTGFSLDLSRRPVSGSMLSYAGARDPVTGQVWGGVRSTGASLHLSRSWGRLSGSVDMDYHWLTGVEVASNTEQSLRLGVDRRFIDDADMQLSAGLAVSELHYREDLSNYSFGQGGYYSPQQNHSLAMSLRWTGRERRWSYLLQGTTSMSTSYSNQDIPYFPTDPGLQHATGNPIYSGGKSHGMYYSLDAALEYRLSPRLTTGAKVGTAHTAYYSPHLFTFYLRYLFDPAAGKVSYPPQAIIPYSQY